MSSGQDRSQIEIKIHPIVESAACQGRIRFFGIIDSAKTKGLQAGMINVPPDGNTGGECAEVR